MTLRTTSATRRKVVSRSSEVASTSATSSSRDSAGEGSGLEITESMNVMIAAGFCAPVDTGTVRFNGNVRKRLWWRGNCACLFSRYYTNIGKVAVFFGVVQPIAHDEFIWDLESDVVAFQGQFAAGRLVEERRYLQG